MYRSDIINWLIKKYNFKSYLEIGYYKGWSFDLVSCDTKLAVDPNPCKTSEQEAMEYGVREIDAIHCTASETSKSEIIKVTSDDFFKLKNYLCSTEKWDIIFIDGLHEANQVTKDIENSLKYLSDGGIIVLHDCNPPLIEHTTTGVNGCWTGDVYKALIKFRARYPNICYTIDTDWGVGIIKSELNSLPHISPFGVIPDWEDFDENRKEYLNLISVEEFQEKEKIDG